jgi:striatin 1/3/4
LEEADPSITFRGHTNVVTAVAISASQNRVYSASLDSTIRVWNLPSEDRGPFSPVGKLKPTIYAFKSNTVIIDPSLNVATYVGHTDAIWDFSLSPENHQTNLLASASADGTVKIWDTQSSGNLLKSSWTFDGVSPEESRKNRGNILIYIDYSDSLLT